jgi:hypothetical protein
VPILIYIFSQLFYFMSEKEQHTNKNQFVQGKHAIIS